MPYKLLILAFTLGILSAELIGGFWGIGVIPLVIGVTTGWILRLLDPQR